MADDPGGAGRGFATVADVFVGRRDALARLRRVASVPQGVVVLSGEAGVGKTRLLRESIIDAAEDRTVLHAHGRRLSVPFPMGPVIDALSAAPEPGSVPRRMLLRLV